MNEAIRALNEKGSPFKGGEAQEVIKNGLSEESKAALANLKSGRSSDIA